MASPKDIFKAWTSKLPVDQEWYQERLKKCGGCKFMSANATTKPESTSDKLLDKLWGIMDKDFCTLCGCPVAQKASLKHEICALGDRGGIPEWGALEILTQLNSDAVKVLHVEGQEYSLQFSEAPTVWLGKVDKELVEFAIDLEHKEGYTFRSVVPSCGCTVPQVEKVSENVNRINIKLSTAGFNKGVVTSKSLTINYTTPNTKTKTLVIRCKLEKI